MNNINVGILGTGSYLPEKIVTNKDLEQQIDTTDEWIRSRTGIEERRIAKACESTSDLGIIAAKKALEDANVDAKEIDLIIVATLTPDYTFPSTACIIQHQLGAKKAAAYDLSAACSGFIYGVASGAQFIESGLYKYVLVIGAETITKILDWEDRSTCVLFGDGAGACVLGPVNDERGFKSFVLGSDGSGGALLSQPSSGSKQPITPETIAAKANTLKMVGSEVFKFAVRVMGNVSEEAVEKSGLRKEDIDFFVPHQANIRIIEPAMKRLGLGMDKVYINLNKYGNMSSASIPVALDEAIRFGQIKKGDTVILVGFGAGLTWGATVVTM
ncbi:beta-ketoacyl-ACP synthase III [Desulfuribacillus alkaliarsenatis]|uniref:Beta-ketoacyl-[acyl-carrier-protein] synthase III n=1 Tax=Desulfuribacillus alkaliarsenatis TaxID=766136 RepID=A0A1E5G5T3_9FIRM|nr:beta-ketoacyl-ACP synthase III [Desulfuribacillus alkaliarsenatis]OEF98557.1 3-oxoacyl-ACP synthase [Desulfuribacillus alkaliarsenatis]